MEIKTKKGVEVMTTDEHPRPNVDPAKLAKLAPVFKKDGWVRHRLFLSFSLSLFLSFSEEHGRRPSPMSGAID